MSLSTQHTHDSPSRLGANVTFLVGTSPVTWPRTALTSPAELGQPHLSSHNSPSTGMWQCLHFLFWNNFRLIEKLQKEDKDFLYSNVSQPFSHYCPPSPQPFLDFFFLIGFCCEILIPQIYCKYTCELCIYELYMEKEWVSLPPRTISISVSTILPHGECMLYILHPDSPHANIFPYLLYCCLSKCVYIYINITCITYIHINIHMYLYLYTVYIYFCWIVWQ